MAGRRLQDLDEVPGNGLLTDFMYLVRGASPGVAGPGGTPHRARLQQLRDLFRELPATLGTSLQNIRVNAAGTALEYFSPSIYGEKIGTWTVTADAAAPFGQFGPSRIDASNRPTFVAESGVEWSGTGDTIARSHFTSGNAVPTWEPGDDDDGLVLVARDSSDRILGRVAVDIGPQLLIPATTTGVPSNTPGQPAYTGQTHRHPQTSLTDYGQVTQFSVLVLGFNSALAVRIQHRVDVGSCELRLMNANLAIIACTVDVYRKVVK